MYLTYLLLIHCLAGDDVFDTLVQYVNQHEEVSGRYQRQEAFQRTRGLVQVRTERDKISEIQQRSLKGQNTGDALTHGKYVSAAHCTDFTCTLLKTPSSVLHCYGARSAFMTTSFVAPYACTVLCTRYASTK